VTYESDLFGSLKASGPLAPKTTGAARPGSITGAADHPINPKIIGTAEDAQLNAALDWLKNHPQAAAR
jgi:hypothetical protein